MIDFPTTQKGIVAYLNEQGLNEGRNKILDEGVLVDGDFA